MQCSDDQDVQFLRKKREELQESAVKEAPSDEDGQRREGRGSASEIKWELSFSVKINLIRFFF